MKRWIRSKSVLFAALLLGLLAAAVLLGQRIELEQENHHVSVVMSYADVTALCEVSETPIPDCLAELSSRGLSAIVLESTGGLFDPAAARAVRDAGLRLALVPDRDMGNDEYLAARADLEADFPLYLSAGGAVYDLSRLPLAVGLVEDKIQYTYEPIPGFDPATQSAPMVRVFKLITEYQARYGMFGYEGAEEIENIFLRAATDRSIRVLWLAPFLDPETGAVVGNLSEYAALLEHLSARLLRQGLALDGVIYPIAERDPSPILLFLCGLGLAAAAIFLLETVLPLRRRYEHLLLLLGAAAVMGGHILLPGLTERAMAFGAALIFPCLASCLTAKRLNALVTSESPGLGKTAASGALVLLGGLGVTLAGCLFVGATLSGSKYLLSVALFSGVKASQALPLLYALVFSALLFWHTPGHSLLPELTALLSRPGRRSVLYILLFLVVLACAAAFFVYGTGDNGFLRGGLLERRFRNLLEAVFLVRPRLKELLAAWPALVLAVYFAGRGRRGWAWLMFLPCAAGFASVTNTFCHIRASVLTSLLRTFYGAVGGYLFGLLCVCLIRLLFFRKSSKAAD